MYDVDGNGWIDLEEMTRLVGSIYKMLGQHQLVQQVSHAVIGNMMGVTSDIWHAAQETAGDRARSIFERMDANNDGRVTRDEFMRSCMADENMIGLLTPPGWENIVNIWQIVYKSYQCQLHSLHILEGSCWYLGLKVLNGGGNVIFSEEYNEVFCLCFGNVTFKGGIWNL